MNGLGWDLADAVMGLWEQVGALDRELESLRWWRWWKRRALRRWRFRLMVQAGKLEALAREDGLDLAPLFGRPGGLRLIEGAASSGDARRQNRGG